MKNYNLVGNSYGRLIVLECVGYVNVGNKGERKKIYKCQCECGNIAIIKGNCLTSNHTKSCGCLEKESKKTASLKHGLRKHPLYSTWLNMKDRCNNKNNTHYKYYGAKNVKMCEEWSNDFKIFHDWALENNWIKGLSIERKDNNKGYDPNNCKWIEKHVQAKNRNINIMIEKDGRIQCLSDWCVELGLNKSTIYSRVRTKWNKEDLLNEIKQRKTSDYHE